MVNLDGVHFGEINPHGQVGQFLTNFVSDNCFKTIVEIGTSNGLGSTLCILLGLQDNSTTKYTTLEIRKDQHELAISNLTKVGVLTHNTNLVWGSILQPAEIDELDLKIVFPEIMSANFDYSKWHAGDMRAMNESPFVLSQFPAEIDFCLFDGGEFTTYYEFKKLFPRIKKYIALDDVKMHKCLKIREFLTWNPEWREVLYIPERNGFALYERVL
jgi:hypothetical protein